jgi:L-lysine 2,3-aminomutase
MDREQLKQYLKDCLRVKITPYYDWINDDRRVLEHCFIKIMLEDEIILEFDSDDFTFEYDEDDE